MIGITVHENSRLIFQKYALPRFSGVSRVLEVGPNGSPSTFQELVDDPAIEWETLDLKASLHQSLLAKLTYVTESEYEFPVEGERFDIVLSGQVIEHVRQTWRWMGELARVCRPGGLVITIAPVSWPYHEDPVDCWRIYPEGLRALYDEVGLETELAVCEGLEPAPDLRREKWFLAKQTAKAFVGKSPFLQPLSRAVSPTLDTIAIGRKTNPASG